MIKKGLLALIVCALLATPTLANPTGDGESPHLGWWAVGADGSTHQYWDFVKGVIPAGPGQWRQDPPDELINPSFAEGWVRAETYNSGLNLFTDNESIGVLLVIENFPNPNAYKEIWIDVGFTGTLINAGAAGGGGVGFTTVNLDPPGPSGVAELGFRIYPNPPKEDIWFTITPLTGPAVLEWIHVDTICIPAPGAILLGGIGVCLVGWLKRRRTL